MWNRRPAPPPLRIGVPCADVLTPALLYAAVAWWYTLSVVGILWVVARRQVGMIDADLLERAALEAGRRGVTRRVFVEEALVVALGSGGSRSRPVVVRDGWDPASLTGVGRADVFRGVTQR